MIIAAIDSGVKNFALSIECVLDDALGTDAEVVLLASETLFFGNYCLDAANPVDDVTRILDALSGYWRECDVVLVERQVQYRGVVNTAALRIAHHCLSYFRLKHPAIVAVDYPSANKTRLLGAPDGMTKPERKKWAVAYAGAVYAKRGDTRTAARRENMPTKLDDVSDCLLMCLAYATRKKPGRVKILKY